MGHMELYLGIKYLYSILVHIRIDKFIYSWLKVSSSFTSREICSNEYFLNPGMTPDLIR